MNNKFKVDKQNGTVAFNEEKHIYLDLESEKTFISVTTLISKYHEHFHEGFWSNYKAYEELFPEKFKEIKGYLLKSLKTEFPTRFIKKLNKTEQEALKLKAQEYVDKWETTKNEACERGTAYHLGQELAAYGGTNKYVKKYTDPNKSYPCKKNDFDLSRENGIYPEYLIHWSTEDDELKIAGQVDLLIKGGNKLSILDFKTNREIKTSSFFDRSKGKNKKMLYPLNDLDDCNFYHYAMQLSTYAWMLQKNEPKFRIKELVLLHYDHDGNEKEYPVPYLKMEVENMVNHFKQQLFVERKKKELDELIKNTTL